MVLDLTIMSPTIRLTVKHGKSFMSRHEVITAFNSKFSNMFKYVQCVWKMELPTVWFRTFEDERIVADIECTDTFCHGDKIYQMSACDRRKLQLRVSWLPLWSDDYEERQQ